MLRIDMAQSLLRATGVALSVLLVAVACANVAPTSAPTPRPTTVPATTSPSAAAPSAATVGGAAAQLRPPDFGPDVVAAAEQILAHEGVGTYTLTDAATNGPIVAVSDRASPLQLTDEQARASALD